MVPSSSRSRPSSPLALVGLARLASRSSPNEEEKPKVLLKGENNSFGRLNRKERKKQASLRATQRRPQGPTTPTTTRTAARTGRPRQAEDADQEAGEGREGSSLSPLASPTPQTPPAPPPGGTSPRTGLVYIPEGHGWRVVTGPHERSDALGGLVRGHPHGPGPQHPSGAAPAGFRSLVYPVWCSPGD